MNKFLVKLTVFSYCIGGNRLDFTSHEISKFQKRFSIWNFRFSRFLCSISGTRSSLEFARKISSWNCNPDPCPKLIQFMMRVDVLSNPQNNKKIKFDDVNRIFGHFWVTTRGFARGLSAYLPSVMLLRSFIILRNG